METKYLNWLIGQNWSVNGPNEPFLPHETRSFASRWNYTAESPSGGLQLYGYGDTAEKALDNLEDNCKEWLTQIEGYLNMTFVEND